MTRQRAKELLPVITAFAEGKTIQCSFQEKDSWNDDSGVDSDYCFDSPVMKHRVKPTLQELNVRYCALHQDHDAMCETSIQLSPKCNHCRVFMVKEIE